MNNKGFTLIELLGVIVVLAIIMAIAVPSIMGINKSIKDNMLDKKVEMIEEAAILYGQTIKNPVMGSNKKYDSYNCLSYSVYDLVDKEYLDEDNDVCTPGNCVEDPSDPDNYLDNLEVIIYFKNKRIYAKVDVDDTLSCS